ncbi:MAG: hypothetical protein RIA69_12730 [Cyclobacteriaceae bacterium]
MTKQINFSNPGEIDPSKVKQAVFDQIDFELPEYQWEAIDKAFAHTWNTQIGIRGAFYNDEVIDAVFAQLQSKKILVSFERVQQAVAIMLDFIEKNGGLLEDDSPKDTQEEDSSSIFLIQYSDGTSEKFMGEFSDAFKHGKSKKMSFSVESC